MNVSPNVTVNWLIRSDWKAVALLQRVAEFAIAQEGFRDAELSIAVVGARRMAALHEQFSGVPGATDVLTFDLGTFRAQRVLRGEIIVCSDIARQVARRRGRRDLRGAVEELALYVTHGVLHLSGYDDHSPAAFDRMHAREDQLLEAFGLGRVFSS